MGKVRENRKAKETAETSAAGAAYETLLNDISNLYEEKVGMGMRQRNEQLVLSYWLVRNLSDLNSFRLSSSIGRKLIFVSTIGFTVKFL